MPLRFELSPAEMAKLNTIASQSLTRMVYHEIAQYMAPLGFTWASATGILKRQLGSEFKSFVFADVWYPVYQSNRQKLTQQSYDGAEQIPIKDYIERGLSQDTKYLYVVDYKIYDSDGNIIDTKQASYYSDDRLTPEDVEYRAESVFSDWKQRYPNNSYEFTFSSAIHNAAYDY